MISMNNTLTKTNFLANQTSSDLIEKIEKLSTPLTYYGLGDDISVDYISDIHLLHHKKFYNNDTKQMLRKVTKSLAKSATYNSIKIINGDLATDSNLVIKFFQQLVIYCSQQNFTYFKYTLNRYKELFKTNKLDKQLEHQQKYKEYLMQKIEKTKSLLTNFDLQKLVNYRNRYRPNEDLHIAFKSFSKVKSFQKLNLSNKEINSIKELTKLLKQIKDCREEIATINQRIEWLNANIEDLEKECGKPLNEIKLTDYKLGKLQNVYFILGNHEYFDFSSVPEAVNFYKTNLAKYGVIVLQNEMVELKRTVYNNGEPKQVNYILYGGTGFAKYDEQFNANNTLCYDGFTRENEIEEGSKFEEGYYKALAKAKQEHKCFLCASHYPVLSCLGRFNQETIYFTGHNHINYYEKSEDRVIYADNQIGYSEKEITFRQATTGIELNPYRMLEDGIHETTIEDYLQFYRYVGEYITSGKYLHNLFSKGNRTFYVIKQNDYFGFFILCSSGPSKGISIVNGGKTKKLTKDTDIKWIERNFSQVLFKYFKLLAPLRSVQNQLSKELRKLGLDGKIHGCIVDIDYYHHIMINPADGTIQFYYSPIYGQVKFLNNFRKVIESLHENSDLALDQCAKIEQKYVAMSSKKSGQIHYLKEISNKKHQTELLATDTTSDEEELVGENNELQYVSRTEGMYGVSKKIQPLQRLFSGHILRDFDLRLIEDQLPSYRKKLYTGRVLCCGGELYLIVEDNGSDVITAEEMELPDNLAEDIDVWDEDVVIDKRWLIPTGHYRKFIVKELRNMISSKLCWETYWVQCFSQETIEAMEEGRRISRDPNVKSYSDFSKAIKDTDTEE